MKTLHLIRHAKSDWSRAGQRDFDRALNARGLNDAPQMAAYMKTFLEKPDAVFCSTAHRARMTAASFLEVWGDGGFDVFYLDEIYEARWDQLLELVNKVDDKYDEIVFFGHNPGFSQLATYLSGNIIEMPTCAMVSLNFAFDEWKLVSSHTGMLLRFDFPKKFTT